MAGSGTAHLRPEEQPLLSVENLTVTFPGPKGSTVHAVSDVSFDVLERETVSIVGESGCGKSTTGRAVLRLIESESGSVRFEGQDLPSLRPREVRKARMRMQMVFQDPISSLNPRLSVRSVVGEGLDIWGTGDKAANQRRIDEVLHAVGLDPAAVGDRRPGQFSGGQCQRIGIARALAVEPSLLICDEPVSALDVSVQAQILNLLEETKERFGLAMVFISHDLAVVKSISDRVIVMYLGKVCEAGPTEAIYRRPAHPYTRLLLDSVPRFTDGPDIVVDDETAPEAPSTTAPPSGCRFRNRCPRAEARCAAEEPTVRPVGDGQYVACHFPLSDDATPDTRPEQERPKAGGA